MTAERVGSELIDATGDHEVRYSTLVAHSPYCIHEIDEEGKLVSMNPAGLRMMGAAAECEIVGTGYLDAVHEDDRPRIARLLQSALAGEFSEFEFVAVNERVFRSNFVPLPSGGVARLMGITQDITDRRELERKLHRSRQLDAIGRLAGGIAHDFNNLLTIIMGESELIASRPQSDVSSRVEAILGAARRAADLTSQLLAFSKNQITRPKRIDLTSRVQAAEQLLRRVLPEHTELVCAYEASPLVVKIDPAQLDQVILNLATNARDAMPRGGRMMIHTRRVQLGSDAPPTLSGLSGDYALLTVADGGEGIAEEDLDRIFEPFFTTKGSAGTGLGLSTAHGVIAKAEGAINALSTTEGTTFEVYLPILDEPVEEEERSRVEDPTIEGTILLVEDNELVQQMAKACLGRAGASVLCATTAEEALDVFAEHAGDVDLLFTDFVLPGMNGRALAEELTRQDPRLNVLYASGYTEDTILAEGVLKDELHFLQKPYSYETLVQAVAQALER